MSAAWTGFHIAAGIIGLIVIFSLDNIGLVLI